MWFYGLAKFKRNIDINSLPTDGNNWCDFICAGKRFYYIGAVTESGKRKLYYASDSDISSASDKIHVWTEGTGWVDNSYRGIAFATNTKEYEYVEAWSDRYATWLRNNLEYYLHDGAVDEYNGITKVHYASWVFPETFKYEWQTNMESYSTFSIGFTSGGTSYTSIKIVREVDTAYGLNLYYGSTLVYHHTRGWQNPKYRIIRCNSLAVRDDPGVSAFFIGAASENIIIDYGGYKGSAQVGQKLTIPCSGKKLSGSIGIYAGPHVGTIKVFYNNTLVLTHKVPTTLATSTADGNQQAITIPNKGLPMRGNIVVELPGN